jgi:hypothetical protein
MSSGNAGVDAQRHVLAARVWQQEHSIGELAGALHRREPGDLGGRAGQVVTGAPESDGPGDPFMISDSTSTPSGGELVQPGRGRYPTRPP